MRLILAAAVMLVVQAQAVPVGTGVIQGTVVSAVGNTPVAKRQRGYRARRRCADGLPRG